MENDSKIESEFLSNSDSKIIEKNQEKLNNIFSIHTQELIDSEILSIDLIQQLISHYNSQYFSFSQIEILTFQKCFSLINIAVSSDLLLESIRYFLAIYKNSHFNELEIIQLLKYFNYKLDPFLSLFNHEDPKIRLAIFYLIKIFSQNSVIYSKMIYSQLHIQFFYDIINSSFSEEDHSNSKLESYPAYDTLRFLSAANIDQIIKDSFEPQLLIQLFTKTLEQSHTELFHFAIETIENLPYHLPYLCFSLELYNPIYQLIQKCQFAIQESEESNENHNQYYEMTAASAMYSLIPLVQYFDQIDILSIFEFTTANNSQCQCQAYDLITKCITHYPNVLLNIETSDLYRFIFNTFENGSFHAKLRAGLVIYQIAINGHEIQSPGEVLNFIFQILDDPNSNLTKTYLELCELIFEQMEKNLMHDELLDIVSNSTIDDEIEHLLSSNDDSIIEAANAFQTILDHLE